MKDSSNTAKKLLDLPYAPEAEQYLDELERSGQFRVGLEAEIDDAEVGDAAASNDYALGPRLRQRLDPGLVDHGARRAARRPGHRARATSRWRASTIRCWCAPRTASIGCVLEGYLGLIPDASTLRIIFSDGSEWTGAELLARIASWLTESRSDEARPGLTTSSLSTDRSST